MNEKYKENCFSIFNSVKPYIANNLKVLNLGCDSGSKVFPFLSIKPQEILGIDKNESALSKNNFEFIKYFKEYPDLITSEVALDDISPEVFKIGQKLKNYEISVHFPSLDAQVQQMKQTVKFNTLPIEKFKFDRPYDLIIASNSLHFLSQATQNDIITKIYNSLSKNGVFYLRNNTVEKCSKEGWFNKDKPKRIIKRGSGFKEVTYNLNRKEDFVKVGKMFTKTIDVTNLIPGILSEAYVYIK